ncbi:MAG: hypothetical protein HGA44_06675 [Cellulomonadaceae bacterium]|nr:hypothetical protein [Cellulomonadaceae bacterium]
MTALAGAVVPPWDQGTGSEGVPGWASVRGGPGSTSAVLADLERAAATLERAADALHDAGRAAWDLSRSVDDAARWSPPTAHPARAATSRLLTTHGGLHTLGERVRCTAESLRRAAALYDHADADVSSLLGALTARAGLAFGETGPVVMAATAIGGAGLAAVVAVDVLENVVALRALRQVPVVGGWLTSLGAAVRGLPGPAGLLGWALEGDGLLPPIPVPDSSVLEAAVPGVAGAVLGALPGRYVLVGDPVRPASGVLMGLAYAVTTLAGSPPTGLRVAPVLGPPTPTQAPAPQDASDVLAEVEAAYPVAGAEPGSVTIVELDHPDGTRSWVVAIPGTQETSLVAGANPMDMTSNVELMARQTSDAQRTALAAMQAAGIPPGEPVILAGHSQGGIVAMSLASDTEVLAAYDITAVLTAGSPVGGFDLPGDIDALHLEHTEDQTPALDGTPNPDVPNRTTVSVDLTSSPSALDRASGEALGTAHAITGYVRTAEAIEDWDDPSVRSVEEAVAAVLGPEGTVATRTSYQGVREGVG